MPAINLIGQKFGRLTVISQSENACTPKGKMIAVWNCKCDCGSEIKVRGGHLKSGHTKSCGCYSKENAYSFTLIELSGKRFGRLLVLSYLGNSFWECLCDCGNKTSVKASSLSNSHTQSCGCLSDEKRIERNKNRLEDLTGNKYGLLVVKSLSRIDSSSGAVWICECSCGNETVVHAGNLKKGSVKSCGCLKESLIANEVKKYCKLNYRSVSEYKLFKNPETNQWLRCDVYIPYGENPEVNGFYIEVHGRQHYEYSEFFFKDKKSFENRKKIDKLKKSFAKKYGIYIEIDLRKIKTTEDAIEYIERIMKKTLS